METEKDLLFYFTKSKYTVNELAGLVGVGPRHLHQILRGKHGSFLVAFKLAEYLEIPEEEFYRVFLPFYETKKLEAEKKLK